MKNLFFITAIVFSMSLNAQNIISKNDLNIVDGKYLLKNANSPFTGKLVTYYPKGQIESLSHVDKGIKAGKIKIFYDSGKKLSILYENANHVNYGKIKTWHENGKLSFKGYFADGKLYKSGEAKPFSGTIISKYANGNKHEEAHFIDGYWHGNQTRLDRNGNVIFECIFENNKIVDCPIYNKK
jgi:antitoxin component YwqK of YwqJK toxin-antitoxin module